MRRALYVILVIFGITFLITPVSIPLFLSNAEFSMLNTKWNGISSFAKMIYERKGLVIPLMDSLNNVELKGGTLLIVGPDLRYSSLEIEKIRDFLNEGGTLILMDDFGTGNEILKGLNLSIRFSRKVPVEPFYFKDYRLPIVTDIRDPVLSRNVTYIVLNYPAVIVGFGEGNVYTSRVTLLGKDFRSYPILVELKYGNGRIVLFSDPSVFTNEMIKMNRNFAENFIDEFINPPVYVDEAHHSNFNPYYAGTIVVRRSLDREKSFYVVLAVAGLALFVESGLAFELFNLVISLAIKIFVRGEKVRVEDVVEKLAKEGYDRKILERIVREVGG